MTDYDIRWLRPPKQLEDPERIAIREVLALGKAVYDQRCVLDISITDLARRMGYRRWPAECPLVPQTAQNVLSCRQVRTGQLHGDREPLQCFGMTTFTQLTPTSFG
jgi:hypothetical protein